MRTRSGQDGQARQTTKPKFHSFRYNIRRITLRAPLTVPGAVSGLPLDFGTVKDTSSSHLLTPRFHRDKQRGNEIGALPLEDGYFGLARMKRLAIYGQRGRGNEECSLVA